MHKRSPAMSSETFLPLYSRLDPEITARTRRRLEEAKATKAQSALEYILFAVFGATILIAAIALVITNTATFRHMPNRIADGIAADRVNILVMETSHNAKSDAIGTDALMLLPIKPSTHEVAVTSMPRDLWVKLGKYGQRKIGAALAVGKSAGYPGEGTGLTADTIQSELGQEVHGYITVDRKELESAIDAVGGVDVDVQHSFYEYATRDRFTKGHHHVDGATALRYALSPYVLGPANDRFAREARQQQIIAALAAKVTAAGMFERFDIANFGDHTNLEPSHITWLASNINGHEPRRVTLAPYVDTFEVASFAESGEAVRPRAGDFHQLREIVANVFSQTAIAAN